MSDPKAEYFASRTIGHLRNTLIGLAANPQMGGRINLIETDTMITKAEIAAEIDLRKAIIRSRWQARKLERNLVNATDSAPRKRL